MRLAFLPLEFSFPDAVGTLGTLIVAMAYFATQLRYLSSEDVRFPLLNLVGSCLITYSLYYQFNLASALMEFFWICISLVGIWNYARYRNE